MIEAIKGRYYQAIYGNFEGSLDAIGGLVMFGGSAILLAISGVTYYLPLEYATKFNVWAVCGLAFLALAWVMIVWFVAVTVVGIGKGTRDAVRQHQHIVRSNRKRIDALTLEQRARYDQSVADAELRRGTSGPMS